MGNSRKRIMYLLAIQIIAIFSIAAYYNSGKNILGFIGILLMAMLVVTFFFGFYVLQLKKSVVGLCNLKKRKVFEKQYFLYLLECLPALSFLMCVGLYFEAVPVVLCIFIYQIINCFLITINVKKSAFIAIFIIASFCEMIIFLLYLDAFFNPGGI